jgi:hypothetical protein
MKEYLKNNPDESCLVAVKFDFILQKNPQFNLKDIAIGVSTTITIPIPVSASQTLGINYIGETAQLSNKI